MRVDVFLHRAQAEAACARYLARFPREPATVVAEPRAGGARTVFRVKVGWGIIVFDTVQLEGII